MRDIVGYESLYAVTSCGKVWSYRRQKFLTPSTNEKGYLYISLYKNGKYKRCRLHRLVAEAYIPNIDNLPQVNHKDENKANNCLQNLEWCDQKYNINYGTGITKRSNKLKIPILQYSLDGEFIREWPSATDAGKELKGHICDCLKGRRKTAANYIWKYKN